MKPIRVVIVALAAAVLLSGCFPPAPALTSQIGPDPAGQFIMMTNRDRVANGLPALRVDSILTGLAQQWAAQIAHDGYFHHRDLEAVLQGDTRGYYWLAENNGNVPLGDTTQSLEDIFVTDQGHRANMMDTRLNIIGVGTALDSAGTLWVVVDFAGVNGG
jgi:uncharacterized protein YkwD